MKCRKYLDVYGDVLRVFWNGGAWVSPRNGQQHSSAECAMRSELRCYFSACGEEIDSPDVAEEIENHLSHMEDCP